jgi:Fur family transcriptional regulator, peroxide stress response regulator
VNLDEVLDQLKQRGLRITPQRVRIVKLLYELPHPTADEIYSVMAKDFPYVSHATVYNTLKLLKEQGIVTELAYSNRVSHYEVAQSEHWHFNCKVCGEIYDIDDIDRGKRLEMPQLGEGFHIDSYRIELYGTCPKCSEQKPQ